MTCYLLGYILWDSGELEEGLQFMKNAYHDSKVFGGSLPPPESLEYFQTVVQARKDLRAGFAGGGRPLNLAELVKVPAVKARLAMAEACFREGEYAAAASLYESVFGDQFNEASLFMLVRQGNDPYWLGLQLGFSIRAAALASGGAGRNRIPCTEFDRARARRQSYNRFVYIMKPFNPKTLAKLPSQFGNPTMVIAFSRCLKDRDLAPVRGRALDQFPPEEFPPEERSQWLELWENVRQVVSILKTKD